MRRSSFSDADITEVVRTLEAGRPAHEICATWQISMRTLYRWKRKFGTLKPFAVEALRRLEQENHRLKAEAGRSASPRVNVTAGVQGVTAIRSDLGSGNTSDAPLSPPVVMGRYASLRVR